MIAKDFGEYMRNRRLEADFESMEALARASGVSAPTIMRIEVGKTKVPSIATLKKLAVPLKVPLEELMEAAGYFSTSDSEKDNIVKEEKVEYSINSTKEAVFNLINNPEELAKLDRSTLVRLQAYISAVLDFANKGDLTMDDLLKVEKFKKYLRKKKE